MKASISDSRAGTLERNRALFLVACMGAAALVLSPALAGAADEALPTQPADAAKAAFDTNSRYYFDGTISRQTLASTSERGELCLNGLWQFVLMLGQDADVLLACPDHGHQQAEAH